MDLNGSIAVVDVSDAELFAQVRCTAASEVAGERAREMLVRRYEGLVGWAVHRYGGRGEEFEELQQVGYLGLVEAIERFDVDRGVDFVRFATPTILGEIRRHFRDRRRWVRIPRKIQELKLAIRDATDTLVQQTGHQPSHAELAAHLQTSEDEITEALAVDDTFAPLSLDAPVGEAAEDVTYGDLLASETDQPEDLVDSEALWPLLERLPHREQQLLLLRFFGNKTQTDIADRLGVSQMHVSRLLQQTLQALRHELVRESTPDD